MLLVAMPSSDERLQAIIDYVRGDGLINEVYVAEQVAPIARDGDGAAALLMAVISAIGYGCERDWTQALDWLATAAERGVTSAQAQLAVLAGAEANDQGWRKLAGRVDVTAWSVARPTHIFVERPHIGRSDGFLDEAACAWLIRRAAPLQTKSLVYDPISGKGAENDARSNTLATFTILNLDLPTLLIRERIANTMGVPVSHFERTSVFRYAPGQEFSSHVDYLTPSPQLNAEIQEWGQRPWTFLIYLNDAFEAGETHFFSIDRKVRGGVGDALFFRNVDEIGAPDEQTTHAGVSPTSGEKWLLSQFIRDKPQLPG